MTRIAVVGVTGRMGLHLVKATFLHNETELTVAIARAGSDVIGKDAGMLTGIGTIGVNVSDDLHVKLNDFDILIDFTRPDVSMKYIEICRKAGKKLSLVQRGITKLKSLKLLKRQKTSQLSLHQILVWV